MFPRDGENPIDAFAKWYDKALDCLEIKQPDAVNIATVTKGGVPSSRMVLLKGFNESGFTFFTNYNSQKAQELAENPNIAMCFFWQPLGKQVRIVGQAHKVPDAESDQYFATRAKQSQIGAWASKQSQELDSKARLIAQAAKIGIKYNIGQVPRPPFWGGYLVVPSVIEFWQQGDFRIHDRIKFSRDNDSEPWESIHLYP